MATTPRIVPLLQPGGDSNYRSLYVGNLDPRVTEPILGEIFRASATGEVLHVKIIPDKNHGGLNYGFVDFADHQTAEAAIQSLNGRKVFDREIKVNWAYQGSGSNVRQDISNHHHVFVGDLCPDITDAHLHQAFCTFGSLSHARVIHDLCTRKSRGYGFLAFRDRSDAERAISTMNGIWLGTRTIRVNWATQKTNNPIGGINTIFPDSGQFPAGPVQPQPATAPQSSSPMLPYEFIFNQCTHGNCTVYFGNLGPAVRESDIMTLFQANGHVVELRHQVERGYAFVRMATHDQAAMAIYRLQGTILQGRLVKISWGKDKYGERGPGDAPQFGAGAPPGGVESYEAYAQYYQQHAAATAAAAATGQPAPMYAGYPNHGAESSTQVPPPVDVATLPPLSDPIAAAAAAAAQAAISYQKKRDQACSADHSAVAAQAAAATAAAMATSAGTAEAYSNDYYAYYYQYYYNQQQQQQGLVAQQSKPPPAAEQHFPESVAGRG